MHPHFSNRPLTSESMNYSCTFDKSLKTAREPPAKRDVTATRDGFGEQLIDLSKHLQRAFWTSKVGKKQRVLEIEERLGTAALITSISSLFTISLVWISREGWIWKSVESTVARNSSRAESGSTACQSETGRETSTHGHYGSCSFRHSTESFFADRLM